jgi:RNA polymerase sigma factor (sigma-70 family)
MCDPTFPEAADEGWWGIAFSHFTGSRRLHSGGRYFSRRNSNAYLVLLVTSEVQVDQHVKPPFEAVVQQHGATVLRVVRAVVGHADADDAWSETFLAALKAYPQLPADANIEAWLVTIAHRKAIDITRGNSRRAVPVADTSDSPAPERADAHDLDLDAAVGALPPKQRQAVAYHYLAGLPYAEIAVILDSSVAAARRAGADGIATLRRTYPLIDTPRDKL